ncbi:MAG: hypothetical protein M3275_01010 [Thermoproteota archaeon]|nr:hypothetical protein [Thermoproteota archaeon]
MEPYPLTEIRSSSSDVSMLLSSSQLISTLNSINYTSSLNSIFGDPFFVDMGSKDTGSRVISTNPILTEDSYIANVTIRGVGNATDIGTFITTYDPNTNTTTTSIGQGIITSSNGNEIAAYTTKDLGTTNEEGEVVYRGIQIFDTNSTGEMSFMDNLVGLYMYMKIIPMELENQERYGSGNDIMMCNKAGVKMMLCCGHHIYTIR